MPRADQIVFIMTDTQRADMVGCYGQPQMHTPNLDRLAARGVRFTAAHCCQPVCGPARAALFTGTWPHSNGGWANSMRHLGQRFQRLGYHTGYVGKWHLDGGDYFGYGRCPEGWDPAFWYDMRCYLEELSDRDRQRSRHFETSHDPGFDVTFTYAHRCSNRALRFLEDHAHERFLLVVSYDEPHDPCLCPPEFVERHRHTELPRSPNLDDTLADKPEHQRVWAGQARLRSRAELRASDPRLFACNSFVDSEIGRVVEAVQRLAPDALVVYTSDHGDALNSHCLAGKGPAMYEEITRIPLIVSWPGVVPAGAVCDRPISHIDVVPTLLDLAGAPIPAPLQGRSAAALLTDPAVAAPATIFMEFGRYEVDHDDFGGFQPVRCAFDGRFKLVVNLLSEDEFYDLQADPAEGTNRIADPACREARDRLHDRLLQWMNETRDPFRGYYWERRPWRHDARPATWPYTGMTRQREPDDDEPRQLDYSTGLDMGPATRPKRTLSSIVETAMADRPKSPPATTAGA